jgi:hypothetical protein
MHCLYSDDLNLSRDEEKKMGTLIKEEFGRPNRENTMVSSLNSELCYTPSGFKLLSSLIFCAMFDHSSYSKLEVICQLSLVIKQIITKSMIFYKNILNKTNSQTYLKSQQ